jgi:hypothetical protein
MIAAAIALASASGATAASADGSFTAAVEESRTSAKAASEKSVSAQVDAPATLPLFAGALAVLGWRMGRRRRR